jgi:hypothetical protein
MAKQMPIKTKSFGSCVLHSTSPSQIDIKPTTKVLNINVSFEEALKLNLAVQEGLSKLNKYDRRPAKQGKNMGLCLAIFFERQRLTVTEAKLP